MGEHKRNRTAIAAKEGLIPPKKRERKLSKRALAAYMAANGWGTPIPGKLAPKKS